MSYCYQYFNHHLRWIDARYHCQNIGADLAKITSREVQDFVFRLGLDQRSFNTWIGLQQQVVGNTKSFVWTDGSHLGNFTFWSDGEPQQGQNICVEMLHNDTNGRWGTGECISKHSPYVCQKGVFKLSVTFVSITRVVRPRDPADRFPCQVFPISLASLQL